MSEYEAGRIKVILDSFQYHNRITGEELMEIHVPSTTFPTKTTLLIALKKLVDDGKLRLDREDRYVRI
jgi:hypothetical protein